MSVLSQTYDKLTIDTPEKLNAISPDVSDCLRLLDGQLLYFPNFFATNAESIYQLLQQQLAWQEWQIKMFGKMVTIPRLQAWYGDADARYKYSGVIMQPHPWHWSLVGIKEQCQQVAKCRFNSVLANWYRHQQDSMGWHSDNEKELGDKPVIASLSFGHPRRFCLRNKSSGEKLQIALKSGSLLLMRGNVQNEWQHAVPKSTKAMAGRINLTYRMIKQPADE
ncbi:alpha-ketoglutarate-dependent dioxygenase AlkB [Thalassotalea sp. HSM 43]|uniref:alpha-ketoglutarate-dependent dioxygenase AlkB family protein n=1 Tax=Thalassotalea sp. HSM 43 TaxID=2552945 RepID=UPI0010810C69|nr:alpha-ketoglutarate-dependent dioxygenase AlkB [Thalassotalea sp. HSM 43]QBY05117.1 alpha-ketoglutarate-dependent dioxygenase AlkB [Thalassotalea sp. HSM 43]